VSAVTDILSQVPLEQLSEQLGVGEKETKTASTQVITSLLAGMTANAQNTNGEQSLASALIGHLTAGQSYASQGVDLTAIDTKDGSKIVQHALGESTAQTAAALSAKTGTDQSLLQKLLPILAPIVIAYIANKAMGGKTPAPAQSSGNLIGSLVGGLLGGNSPTTTSNPGGLGSMLGGLLGGVLDSKSQSDKGKQNSGGVLQDLLNTIF